MTPVSVLEALAGKGVLMTGSTGFIGKVLLAMLLDRQPGIGKVFLLVRPKPGRPPEDRLFEVVASSPVFEPLRRSLGPGFGAFLRERLEVLPGDSTLPHFGLASGALEALKGRVHLVLNNAGLVALNPPLDESLAANAYAARHGAELAAGLGAALVHVSTCYVAGLRSGEVREEEPALGYYPWQDKGLGAFDAVRELADCERAMAEIRARAAGSMQAVFLRQARGRRVATARPARSDEALRGAIARLAKRWISEQLVEEGRRRARSWGWANAYCYAKAMGEQLVAATPGLRYAVVRPSIVESALRFPFPGWNEGLNTSAPVILAMCRGHALWPAHPTAALDVIPVDLVCAGILAACGAALQGRHRPVYHLGSSDANPLPVRRCMRFVGEYRRRHWRDHHPEGPLWEHWLWMRRPVRTVPAWVYRWFGVPLYRRAVSLACRSLARLFPGFKPGRLETLERELGQVEHVVETFMPFIHDTDCVFRTDAVRELYAGLPETDRERLPWDPERLDWRSYWFDVHTAGLRRWVFPGFSGRGTPGKPPGHWPVVRLIRQGLTLAQKAAYSGLFRTRVSGAVHIPASEVFIVAANHASHLDMGLVKHALGAAGSDLAALAAKDYFFSSPLLGFFFRHFTNLIPIGRSSAIKDSLRGASEALRRGRKLLIFPEATRSVTGRMAPFKSTVGYLALQNKVGVLPAYVSGTFEALPKGWIVPKGLSIGARFGPLITYEELKRRTEHLPPKEAYRVATAAVEEAVRCLAEEAAA